MRPPTSLQRLANIEATLSLQLVPAMAVLQTSHEIIRCKLDNKLLLDAEAAGKVLVQVARTDNHDTRLDVVEKEISELRKAVDSFIWPMRVLYSIGAILGVSVIGLIWSIITHTVILSVP